MMKVPLALAMVALIASGTADHQGVQELSETQTAARETVQFDDFNFNAESEGWVDMGDAPDMGEALGGCAEECTDDNKKCYKTSQDKCKSYDQDKCISKGDGYVWCGATPAPTPPPYICPTTVDTTAEDHYWINKVQCLSSELVASSSENVMVSASGVKKCVDSLNLAQNECLSTDNCDSAKLEAASQGLMTKACDSMTTKPACCATNNCDASVCWIGLDTIQPTGGRSKGKVAKSVPTATVSLTANGVNYKTQMELEMTVKRVSYCIKEKKRCFTQKACGDLIMTIDTNSFKEQETGTAAAEYKWQSATIPDEGDDNYAALETAKEEKGAELVRMICNSA